MTTVNNIPFELSKLAIDRSSPIKTTRLPVSFAGIFITILLTSSLFFVVKNLFFSESSYDAKANNKAGDLVSNKLEQQVFKQNSTLAPS